MFTTRAIVVGVAVALGLVAGAIAFVLTEAGVEHAEGISGWVVGLAIAGWFVWANVKDRSEHRGEPKTEQELIERALKNIKEEEERRRADPEKGGRPSGAEAGPPMSDEYNGWTCARCVRVLERGGLEPAQRDRAFGLRAMKTVSARHRRQLTYARQLVLA